MRRLEISNATARYTDTESLKSVQPRRRQLAKAAAPQVKDLLECAVSKLQDQSGTKPDILAMCETLYPQLSADPIMQRSLN